MKTQHKRSYRLSAVAILASAMLAIQACGPMRLGGSERAEIVFTNESFDQADVYAYVGGGSNPIRLGTVMSNHTDTLRVPESVTGAGASINIVARRLANSSVQQTGSITLRTGETLQIRLPANGGSLVILPARMP